MEEYLSQSKPAIIVLRSSWHWGITAGHHLNLDTKEKVEGDAHPEYWWRSAKVGQRCRSIILALFIYYHTWNSLRHTPFDVLVP